jgi:hypothetical protein
MPFLHPDDMQEQVSNKITEVHPLALAILPVSSDLTSLSHLGPPISSSVFKEPGQNKPWVKSWGETYLSLYNSKTNGLYLSDFYQLFCT